MRNDASTLDYLAYAPVRLALAVMGNLPRPLARACGQAIAVGFYWGHRRLVAVGRRNLELAFPERSGEDRARILRQLYRHLGRQMAEFCLFPRWTEEDLSKLMRTEGLEHYIAAREKGRGVLVVTAHLGAWELSSFGHSLAGYPMKFVVRPLDNEPLNRLVNAYRGKHGNQPIGKGDFARGLLQAMGKGETVGILLDQNTWPPQGVFVPFFGLAACTAVGPAKIAGRTGAAVVPGFTVWEEKEKRYVLRFERELELQHTDDEEADVLSNTARLTAVIENWVRRYPDQWLWVHRRWKTRPAGEEPIY